jgi:uncharacterized linocin/CFP29 family protein
MSSLLRREMAPISPEAWAAIDEEATRVLRGNLSARGLVEVDGPHGFELGAVNLGQVEAAKDEAIPGVQWGLRKVQPLTEIRVPFTLDLWQLDNIARGAKDTDLDELTKAAQRMALFEEQTLYQGFEKGGMAGIVAASANDAVKLSGNAGGYLGAVEAAIVSLQKNGIGGPYALVLGSGPYQKLAAGDEKGYPLRKRIEDLIQGGVHWSPALSSGVVMSVRGGDYEMTLGQDASIGYQHSADGKASLYLTESFTFRVLEPGAATALD